MRYIGPIGSQDDFIERKLNRPKYYACPECGKKGKRKRVKKRWVKHIGPLYRRSWIHAKVGVYHSSNTRSGPSLTSETSGFGPLL